MRSYREAVGGSGSRRPTGGARKKTSTVGRRARSDKTRQTAATAIRTQAAATERSIAEATTVTVHLRRGTPRVIAHVGPTNSGKTHAAVLAIVAAGRGAYASPLRMLAQEIHERLAAALGAGEVGLVTGEERINERAPVIACTTELAPMRTEVLVIDEVHWAADSERGTAWTRLLLGAECRELHLVGAADSLPLLTSAFPDLEVHQYERFSPLRFVGPVRLTEVEGQSVVVAFSRKAVMALARELAHAKKGRRVGALYGAMPVPERRRQIARFVAGEVDVLVATDVLGHGVNLPCRTVLFAESDKFDGTGRRVLAAWEVAQIAGRAGRFGHHDAGEVGTLTGLPWLCADPRVIERGMHPTLELSPGVFGSRRITTAKLGPSLEDLSAVPTVDWSVALGIWETRARAEIGRTATWLRVADTAPLRARLVAIGTQTLARLDPDRAWAFALAPVDADRQGRLLADLARAVARPHGARLTGPDRTEHASLEEAEQLAERATVLRWFTRRFPGAGGLTTLVADELEASAARRVGELMDPALLRNRFGRCEECGRSCTPWFRRCENCFEGRSPRPPLPLRGQSLTG